MVTKENGHNYESLKKKNGNFSQWNELDILGLFFEKKDVELQQYVF